jgi:capsule polysaccharide export protein KpsE/RkpR
MSGTGLKDGLGLPESQTLDAVRLEQQELEAARERQAALLRLLWDHRRTLFRAGLIGLVLSTLVAFSLRNTYTSTARLMPPDQQSSSGMAMMAALAGKGLGGLSGVTSDLLGLKSSGALFIGILRSDTSENQIIQKFNLKKIYGTKLDADARKILDANTEIAEDRKSGIITVRVTDHDPHRAAEIGNAYIDELNSLVADLSTSAAHRERVFLEERLKVAKVEMDEAANQLAQFSSKNTTLDIQSEGKAMLDAASSIAGQLIAAQSQLEGLRQIYTDNNPRVRTLNGRVAELRRELQKFGGTEQSTMGKSTNQLGADPLTSGNPPLDKGSSSPFPTIKNLPLLGAKYTDYYQRAKIQETVVEMLTEQYELAKVQEAKDTPSVKVLDPAVVPERKSFPPHLLIMASGTVLIFIITAVWLLAVNTWERIDPNDPRKSFALEVAATVRASAPWASQNGDAPHSWTQRFWDRLKNSRSDRSPDL